MKTGLHFCQLWFCPIQVACSNRKYIRLKGYLWFLLALGQTWTCDDTFLFKQQSEIRVCGHVPHMLTWQQEFPFLLCLAEQHEKVRKRKDRAWKINTTCMLHKTGMHSQRACSADSLHWFEKMTKFTLQKVLQNMAVSILHIDKNIIKNTIFTFKYAHENNCTTRNKTRSKQKKITSLAAVRLHGLTCGGLGPGSRWVWPPRLHPHLLPAGSDNQRSGTEHGRSSWATEMPHRCLYREVKAMRSEKNGDSVL